MYLAFYHKKDKYEICQEVAKSLPFSYHPATDRLSSNLSHWETGNSPLSHLFYFLESVSVRHLFLASLHVTNSYTVTLALTVLEQHRHSRQAAEAGSY